MLLSSCRKTIDDHVPLLGQLYRLSRDVANSRRSIQTRYGFTLAGCPKMAEESWEIDEVHAFLQLINAHDIVLDIGANIGFYTCLAASRNIPTIAFEPSLRNLKFLYKNLWENQFTNVEVFPLGLAERSGLRRIYGFSDMASFVSGWAQSHEQGSSLVPLATLDSLMLGRFKGKKLLIKMDVEGSEMDVLAGAAEILDANPRPTWLVEILLSSEVIPGGISGRFADTFEIFWKHGYQCRMLDAGRTSVERADVNRWVAGGHVDSDMRDFLFLKN